VVRENNASSECFTVTVMLFPARSVMRYFQLFGSDLCYFKIEDAYTYNIYKSKWQMERSWCNGGEAD